MKLVVLVILVTFATTCAITCKLYYTMYTSDRVNSFQKIAKDVLDARDKVNDVSDRAVRLQRAMSIGPPVRFRSRVPTGKDDELNDTDDSNDRAINATCLTIGLFLSEQDEYVDCRNKNVT